MTLLRFPEGHVAAVRSLAAGRASSVSGRQRTTSEFGRRAASNGSGTDHGTAAAHLVIGSPVRGGRYGESPDLSSLDKSGNLTHTVDYRSYYASILDEWFEVGHDDILDGSFETLGLVDPAEGAAPAKRIWKHLGLK